MDVRPWRGAFYPRDLARRRELDYAAARLATIEVNATFYGRQKPATFARWAASAPTGFRFSLKGPRQVVGRRDLSAAGPGIADFLASGISKLGDRLGPILWQLPAWKSFDAAEFAAFLALLPARHDGLVLRHAVALRHATFARRDVLESCREAGVAIVHADTADFPALDDVTADFVYARLQRGDDTIETGYSDAALDGWAERARSWAAEARDVFLYIVREGKARAPQAAMALQRRIG